MSNERFVVVCYDISNDKRRNKVALILEDYGVRVQYSVFECLLTDDLLRILKDRLKNTIEEEEDKVYYYYLCERCMKTIETLGNKKAEKEANAECYVV